MSDIIATDTCRIGVVGVGLLGGAVAQRLIKTGWNVVGYDPKPFQVEKLRVCASFSELLKEVNVIIFCLPNSSISLQLTHDNLAVFTSNQIVLDATTGRPEEMEKVDLLLSERGVRYMESNVAGSSEMMLDGDASMFFGGEVGVFHSLSSLINCLTRKPFHLGAVGAASRFKLVHNMILGLHRVVLAEGLAFAEALGIEPSHALKVLKQTPAASEVMTSKGERMVRKLFHPPQARLSQHLKDVRIMLDQAAKVGMKVPLTSLHAELLGQAEQQGLGQMDNSSVAALYQSHHQKGGDHG